MRVVVTGGAGFIGSALCRHMVVQRADEVLNVDKLTYAANLRSLATIACKANYRFAQADVADEVRIAELFKDFEPEAIIHLAAETHVDRSIESAHAFIQTNVVGTSVLLDSARKYWSDLPSDRQRRFRVVMVSTDEVYGSLSSEDDPAFNERSSYLPSSPYAASKAAADHLAKCLAPNLWFAGHHLKLL